MLRSLDDLIKRASKSTTPKRIVIAASEGSYALKAIQDIDKLGFITPIFVGNRAKILIKAKELKYPIHEASIVHADSPEEAALTAVRYMREKKADIIMKGLLSTRTYIRAIMNKEVGISGAKMLSHLALFESPFYHKLFGLTDAAMNIAPDRAMKTEIIQNAVEAFIKLSIVTPKVALLAAVETLNPKMVATTDADYLVRQHHEKKLCECMLAGPLALDLAISKSAAAHKGIDSPVAGDADILVVPEITSGNILYKSLTYLGNARTASVLLGAGAPVILTSRADSPESKFYSIALAVCLCT